MTDVRHIHHDPTPDIPKLRKAVEWVEAEAAKPEVDREWRQQYYFTRDPRTSCGTVYCVAGKVALDEGWQPVWHGRSLASAVTKDDTTTGTTEVARAALGLTDGQAHRLFCGSNSARQVRRIAEDIAGERL